MTPETENLSVPLTADDIRHRMTEHFRQFEPHLKGYHDYAERIAALSKEYHDIRLRDTFPNVRVETLTLATVLDTRHTPKSLDAALAQLQELPIKRIIYDATKGTYSLYV